MGRRGRDAGLIVPQGNHGVELHSADGWEVSGDCSCDEEDERGDDEGGGIGRREAEDHVGDEVGCGKGAWDADENSGERDDDGFAQDELKNGGALRAHGHADSNLASAECDGVGHEAEESEGGDEKSNGGEESGERGRHLLVDEGALVSFLRRWRQRW